MPTGRKGNEESLITALAAGGSVSAAAQHSGLCARTVQRRLRDPGFRARVDEARSEMVSQAVGRLAAVGALAGDTLHQLLGSQRESIRLSASRSVLEFMFRGHEADTLTRQLAELRLEVQEVREIRNGRQRANAS